MTTRHCVFVLDQAELKQAFLQPLHVFVEEFLERQTPGARLQGYAELAFANQEQLKTLGKADRETMVLTRRQMAAGQGPRSELPSHLKDITGDYARTRTTSQFKWLMHAFAASGRMWIREFACNAAIDWVTEAINLLFVQRSFSSSPEEAEEYKMTRKTLLTLTGPHRVAESGNEVSDEEEVTSDVFPWVPRPDGRVHFRFLPSLFISSAARTLADLDVSEGAFADIDRNPPPPLQDLTRKNCERLAGALKTHYSHPVLLAFIG